MGLTHFTEEYADRFFGRDTECALIIGNLRAARLTLLYAESGVGKSSVLRAGVVARLRGFADRDVEARGSPRLVPVVFSSWSDAPVVALIRVIGDAVRPYLPEGAALDLPDDDLEAAIEAASKAIDVTLLIILDQFEEYFLYPEDVPEGKRVDAQLARCVNRHDLRANFLISIREDSYARLGDLFRGKIRNVYANFLHLDFLDRVGAQEAIEKPLDGGLVGVEPALVDAVLDQVRRAPGASSESGKGAKGKAGEEVETTYLQLVMRRLWEVETGSGSGELRLRTLENLGGAQTIISGHLDRAMEAGEDGAGGLSDDQRRVAAAVFHFLVTSGGTKIALTAKDLSDYTKLPVSKIEPVLRHLSSPSLHILRPVAAEDGQGDSRFEVFHDALARPIVEWRTRVEGEELEARVAKERAEKESAQRAAAEAERREAQERKRKRLALALLSVAVTALAGGAIFFGFDQRNRAEERDATAQSVSAAERISQLSDALTFGPTAAALASVEAYRLAPTADARDEALAALQLNPGMPRTVFGHTRGVNAVAYWPDGGGRFASGADDGTVRRWDAQGNELGSPLVGGAVVRSVAVSEASSDGSRIVAAGLEPGAVRLAKIDAAGRIRFAQKIAATNSDTLLGLAFNPRVPTMLAAGDSSGRVSLWDVTDPEAPVMLEAGQAPGEVLDLAFGANGKVLRVASDEGGQAWSVSKKGFASKPYRAGPRAFESVATAPNGSFAFGGPKGIDLWDDERERKLHLLTPGNVYSLAFANDGEVLVSGGTDWNVTTWDVATGRPFGPPRAVGLASVTDVEISPDGKSIAAASQDLSVKLWPLEPPGALATTIGGLAPREARPPVAEVSDLAVGAGWVAAAAGPGGTSIWKLRGIDETDSVPEPSTWLRGESNAVTYHDGILATGKGNSFVLLDTECPSMPTRPCRLAAPARPFSDAPPFGLELWEDGDRVFLASSGFRGGNAVLNLWEVTDARDGEISLLSSLPAGGEIHQLAFSPARALIAVAAQDGMMRVWDVRDPEDPAKVEVENARGNENQAVFAVAFSPNGALLASAGQDQQVVFWRVVKDASGPMLEDISGSLAQTQSIFSLAFSSDGRTLAAGDGDGSACLYVVRNRRPIGSPYCLLGHSPDTLDYGGINALRFTRLPGGETALLSAGTGQPIVAWDSLLWNLSDSVRVEQTIASGICRLAGRNLTVDEWSEVFDSTDLADDHRQTCPQYSLPEG